MNASPKRRPPTENSSRQGAGVSEPSPENPYQSPTPRELLDAVRTIRGVERPPRRWLLVAAVTSTYLAPVVAHTMILSGFIDGPILGLPYELWRPVASGLICAAPPIGMVAVVYLIQKWLHDGKWAPLLWAAPGVAFSAWWMAFFWFPLVLPWMLRSSLGN